MFAVFSKSPMRLSRTELCWTRLLVLRDDEAVSGSIRRDGNPVMVAVLVDGTLAIPAMELDVRARAIGCLLDAQPVANTIDFGLEGIATALMA
jgi:hypothetical protein